MSMRRRTRPRRAGAPPALPRAGFARRVPRRRLAHGPRPASRRSGRFRRRGSRSGGRARSKPLRSRAPRRGQAPSGRARDCRSGTRARAARHVEDGRRRAGLDPVDEEGAPARVLAEREQSRVAVVGLAERREERLGRPVALADALGHGAIVAAVGLEEEIAAAAEAATAHAANGEDLEVFVPAEPAAGARVYLCAYRSGEEQTWLALDSQHRPVVDRAL